MTLPYCKDLSEMAKFGVYHAKSLLRVIHFFPLEGHTLEKVQTFPLNTDETYRDWAPNLSSN